MNAKLPRELSRKVPRTQVSTAVYCTSTARGFCSQPLQSATLLPPEVVGYGQADLNKNYTGVGPMFFAIGEDVTSVQNLVVKNLASAMGTGYMIAPITSTGNIPVKYYYWCGYSEYGIPDGWYITDDADAILAAVDAGTINSLLAPITMAKGEGLVTYMQDTSLALQGSGEVLSGDFTRPLNKNYTGVANPFPANVSVQSYAITDLASAMGTGYTISPITSTGNIPVKYFYWCGYSEYGIPDGWYITDDADAILAAVDAGTINTLLADYTFASGEAAVTYIQDTGLYLKITNPID